MGGLTLGSYVALSGCAAAGLVAHAWATREQFYPAALYLATSKAAVVVLSNFAASLALVLWHLLQKVRRPAPRCPRAPAPPHPQNPLLPRSPPTPREAGRASGNFVPTTGALTAAGGAWVPAVPFCSPPRCFWGA